MPVFKRHLRALALSSLSSGHSGKQSLILSVLPFQTLYNVRAEILPASGAEYCRTGSLCSLEVSITRLADLLDVDKDEALVESEEYFSTKLMYEGRPQALLDGVMLHGLQ